MTRYVTIPPRAWINEHGDYTERHTCAVTETDPTPRPIGILDPFGVPIYRVHETVPMGFQAPEPKPRARTRKRR